jgi:hypothetical protein
VSQSKRPNGSSNPPTGFHAVVGTALIPSRSQPFHGKSLSFTVRGKIGDDMPAWESNPTFSMPLEYSALKYSWRNV